MSNFPHKIRRAAFTPNKDLLLIIRGGEAELIRKLRKNVAYRNLTERNIDIKDKIDGKYPYDPSYKSRMQATVKRNHRNAIAIIRYYEKTLKSGLWPFCRYISGIHLKGDVVVIKHGLGRRLR